LSGPDRDHLVTNIVGHLKGGVKPDMQQRAIEYWTKVDATLGARIRTALAGNRGALEGDGPAAERGNIAR
jgi:catalase